MVRKIYTIYVNIFYKKVKNWCMFFTLYMKGDVIFALSYNKVHKKYFVIWYIFMFERGNVLFLNYLKIGVK